MQSDFGLIASLVGALLAVKLIALAIVSRLFRLPAPEGLLFAFALAQGGEFAFVLFAFATGHSVLPAAVVDPLVAVVALSMAFTPVLMIINERLLQPLFAPDKGAAREADTIDDGPTPVIVADFGRFGNVVGRLLRANGVKTTILDLDPDQIAAVRRFGLKVFYGDAQRLDLLHAAGAEQAKLLILATDDPEHTTHLAAKVRHHYPHLRILARSHSLEHSYDLMHEGVEAYASQIRSHLTELDELIQQDDRDFIARVDHAWEPSPPTTRGA